MISDSDGRTPVDQAGSEAMIAALWRQFEEMLPSLVAAIVADIKALGEDGAERPAVLARLRAAVHDLKGQGSSFGYPLITEFGMSLSNLLYRIRDIDEATMARIVLHGDLLTVVATHRIRGDGGETGLALRAGLARAMA
jgi:chemotaxis protein histidine kinase CheA